MYMYILPDDILSNVVLQCTSVKHRPRRHRQPKHMVRLLHAKRKVWRNGFLSGNFDTHNNLKKSSRAAIR